MNDLIFLFFIIFLWVISALAKKMEKSYTPPKIKNDEGPLLKEPQEIYIENKKEIPPSQKKEEKPVSPYRIKKEILPDHREEKEDVEISIYEILQSKSSLKKAFLLKEILDKPVSERQYMADSK